MKHSPVPDLLFTYGTLRRAAGNAAHRLLADMAELVGHGVVQGRLYQATGFPVLVPDPQGRAVTGEVYRVFAPQAAFCALTNTRDSIRRRLIRANFAATSCRWR